MEDTMRPSSTQWMSDAVCRGTDTQVFFAHSEGDAQNNPNVRALADTAKKAFCTKCPVQEACLNYALATYQRDGIWGGMTEKERTSLRRRIARDKR